jgi:hypothetical protein
MPKKAVTHRVELDRGSIEATTKVAQWLFRMATEGNNVAAAIFWMKARAGWREKHDLEVSGKGGAPLAPSLVIVERVIDPKVPNETGHVIDGIATPDLPAIAGES